MRPLAVTLVIAVVLGAAPSSRAVQPVRVCQHVPITGAAPVDRDPKRFGQFYFDYVNAELGGVDGRPVEFLTYDDQYNPPFAVQAAERCKAMGADLIVGPSGRDQIAAVAKWSARNGIPYLHGSTDSSVTSAFLGPTDEEQARALADLLAANTASMLGDQQPVFAMVRMNSPFYTAAHDAFVRRLEQLGHTLAADAVVQKDQSRFEALWAELQSKRVNLFFNFTSPLLWLKMASQEPASLHPMWANIAPETGNDVSARLIAPDKAVVLHEPSPAYDEHDDTLPWAAEIRRFIEIFDRYSAQEARAPRDDVDWTNYLRAKQIHRLLSALNGDMSRAHILDALTTWSDPSDDAYPSCAVDLNTNTSRRWHVFASPGPSWRQAAFCVGASGPPPTIDFVTPAIDCGAAVQVVTGPLRCRLADASGMSSYTIDVRQATSSYGFGIVRPGGCRDPIDVEQELPTGLSFVTVGATDCAGNTASIPYVVARTP